MALVPVEEALARILDGVTVLGAESVGLLDAPGRVLAENIVAKLTQPPFHCSAMDGYAVRAADTGDPHASLTVIGESQAGHRFAGSVCAGTSLVVDSTGAVQLTLSPMTAVAIHVGARL